MIFSFINSIIDRCIFTVLFIVGVQLPEFIQQYSQRLAGHLDEAKTQLKQFQQLADDHYQGSIQLLVKNYRENQDPVIVDTATVVEHLLTRVNLLNEHLHRLIDTPYLDKIKYFLLNVDLNIAQQTANIYTLAIPIEINALVTGAVLAFSSLVTKELIVILFNKVLYPSSTRALT